MSLRVLTAVAFFAVSSAAGAREIAFVPVPERVGRADAVVVGTVTEIEKDAVEVNFFPAGKPWRFRVAKVKVEDELLGPGNLKEVRAAFVGTEDQPKDDGQYIPTPVLEKDNKVILFLRKRDELYFVDGHFGATGKNPTNKYLRYDLDDEIKAAKPACKVMTGAAKALKSKNEDERMLAAWMLLTRYRAHPVTATVGKTAEESIGVEESRAILEGLLLLAEKQAGDFYRAAYSLNLSKEDGFEQPFTAEKAKQWVKDNAATYRIKKIVPAKK